MGLNYGTICIHMELKVGNCMQQSNPQWKQNMTENQLNIQYIVPYWDKKQHMAYIWLNVPERFLLTKCC